MIGKKKKQAKPLQQAVVLVVRAGPATRPGVLEEHRHGVDASGTGTLWQLESAGSASVTVSI
jgi:hypothetical protein